MPALVSEYILKGKTDLISIRDGETEITDFKSGSKPNININRDRERLETYRRQLNVYAYLVEKSSGLKVNRMKLYYTGESSGNPEIVYDYNEAEAEKVIVSPKNSNLKSLTIASSVAHLDLSACDKLQSLEILRSEIEYLDLSGCSSLEFLEYEDIEDRPFCFDCSACPNLHYVNIQYYNKRSTTIKMDPFFYTHYQKEPYRKRNNETTPDDFYDNIQKYYPWYEHCNAHPGGARIPDMILTYEWYFDAQLIQ